MPTASRLTALAAALLFAVGCGREHPPTPHQTAGAPVTFASATPVLSACEARTAELITVCERRGAEATLTADTLCSECDPARCDFLRGLGRYAELRADYRLAEAALVLDSLRALPYYADSASAQARAKLAFLRVRLRSMTQEGEPLLAAGREALRYSRRAVDTVTAFNAMLALSTAHGLLGRGDSTVMWSTRARGLADAYAYDPMRVTAAFQLCVQMYELSLPGGLDSCRRVAPLLTEHGPRLLPTFHYTLASYHELDSAGADSARHYYARVLGSDADHFRPDVYASLGRLALGEADANAALAYADSAATHPLYAEDDLVAADVNVLRARALSALGRHREAARTVDAAFARGGGLTLDHRRRLQRAGLTAAAALRRPVSPGFAADYQRDVDTTVARAERGAAAEVLASYQDSARLVQIAALEDTRLAQASALTNRNAALGIGLLAVLGLGGAFFVAQRQRRRLARANADIRVLNRELNHRAHNQINLAYQLIRNQQRGLSDGVARGALRRSEAQLSALSSVNRRLSRSAADRVRADEVLAEVAEGLRAASPQPFRLELDLAPVRRPAEEVTKLALVVNELISNTVKYGLPAADAGTEGTVTLSLRESRTPSGRPDSPGLRLYYADDGPGKEGVVRGTGQGHELIGVLLADLEAEVSEPDRGGGYVLEAAWG